MITHSDIFSHSRTCTLTHDHTYTCTHAHTSKVTISPLHGHTQTHSPMATQSHTHSGSRPKQPQPAPGLPSRVGAQSGKKGAQAGTAEPESSGTCRRHRGSRPDQATTAGPRTSLRDHEPGPPGPDPHQLRTTPAARPATKRKGGRRVSLETGRPESAARPRPSWPRPPSRPRPTFRQREGHAPSGHAPSCVLDQQRASDPRNLCDFTGPGVRGASALPYLSLVYCRAPKPEFRGP